MMLDNPSIHMRQLEGLLGFHRQSYYQYWQRQSTQQNNDSAVISMIKQIRKAHPRIGGKKLHCRLKEMLLERGIKMGRDALFDLLAANRLLIRRRRRKVITTFSRCTSSSKSGQKG